jgi:hypothetical protein
MRKLLLVFILLSAPSWAGTAFLQTEVVTGFTKQCIYNYLGNTYILTISSLELCPFTIEVND